MHSPILIKWDDINSVYVILDFIGVVVVTEYRQGTGLCIRIVMHNAEVHYADGPHIVTYSREVLREGDASEQLFYERRFINLQLRYDTMHSDHGQSCKQTLA